MWAAVKFSGDAPLQLARRCGSARVPVNSGTHRRPSAPRGTEAAKYVTDKGSAQGLKVQDYLGRLREIRGR